MNECIGILLSAHGTVENLDDLPAFLARIRRGRPVPQALVEETRHRYQLIGGSPLLRTTREVARKLAEVTELPVFVGMRLWEPSLQQAITEARDAGVTRLISLPLAPQSVQVYHQAAREAAAEVPEAPALIEIPSWGEAPALIDAFVGVIREALARFPESERDEVELVLSAHSLPLRVIAAGDPYEKQFRAMAAAVAARFRNPSRVAFQSQGYDGGEWLGPDLRSTFSSLVAQGKKSVVVAAIGFLGDHVETLYDLDIEAKRLAEEAGLWRYERAPSLNARDSFVTALARVATTLAPSFNGLVRNRGQALNSGIS
ncbi:MAG: ferrochelatase [Myxococcales bacterium]|nr:ferrochelatase [Polyangiaceae bacterium]MDW8252185.1 ferrochelatase [Myxococcales bacterium]